MGLLAFFAGSVLAAVFSKEQAVILAAHDYLRSYAIDCVLTAVLFCFVGYFNGCGRTLFVMIQGIAGAFCVRVPAVYLISRLSGVTLFHIGLATPLSSAVQIALCLIAYRYYRRRAAGAAAALIGCGCFLWLPRRGSCRRSRLRGRPPQSRRLSGPAGRGANLLQTCHLRASPAPDPG